MARKGTYGLGTLQTEVMDVVWKLGEATVSQVAESIGRKRPVTYTTVLVAMQKLEKRGWLKHRSAGRAYVFQATRSKETQGATQLMELLKSTFSGDVRVLINHLLDEHPLSEPELKELRSLIDRRRREKKDG
jgi:predicted transcriptional regulator